MSDQDEDNGYDSLDEDDIRTPFESRKLEAIITRFNKDKRFRTEETMSIGLNAAVDQHDLEIARFCLQHGALVWYETTQKAAQLGSIPLFELFTWYGWNVNQCIYGSGDTVLADAIDHEELLLWLLDRGCDPNKGTYPFMGCALPSTAISPFNNSGYTLNVTAEAGNIFAFDILLKYGAKLENSMALHGAARGQSTRQISMMKHLLTLGVDVNDSDRGKFRFCEGTPLFYAIDAGAVENAQFLLENGADPRKERHNLTALQFAEEKGCQEIVELIKKALQPDVEEHISSLSVS